jgi:hypothetical protein
VAAARVGLVIGPTNHSGHARPPITGQAAIGGLRCARLARPASRLKQTHPFGLPTHAQARPPTAALTHPALHTIRHVRNFARRPAFVSRHIWQEDIMGRALLLWLIGIPIPIILIIWLLGGLHG